jgi:hypothetical protein
MSPSQGQPGPGQQPDLFISRTFTGRAVGSPALGYLPLVATVVSATTSTVVVTVNDFGKGSNPAAGNVSQFTCAFEPRFGSGSTAKTPPAGKQCLVVFTKNSGPASGWVLAFYDWPT